MEIHPHSHTDPAHGGTGRKRFKHYLWEFIMLFLAVFCGFLAENLRELKVEHDREKQFMITMLEDLKSDTAQLSRLITNRKNRIIKLDTLFILISSDRYIKEARTVYSLYEWPYWDILRFFPSDRTMQQLKNAGNLRLIKKQNVSDALIEYDVWVRNRKEYEPIQVDLAEQANQYIEKLIDPVVLFHAKEKMINARLSSDRDTKINIENESILPDYLTISKLEDAVKKSILKYINQEIMLYSELREDNIKEKSRAIKTSDLIKREYRLE